MMQTEVQMTAKIEKFEDLNIWKDSMALVLDLYKLLKQCKDYSLRDQIQRAAVSIPSNIAEGFERQSNKEFIRFLYYSKGSCGELRTQIHLAIALEFIEKEIGTDIIDRTRKISSQIFNLIKARSVY